jgi:hypothetical protein
MISMSNLVTLNNDLFALPSNTTYTQFKNMANYSKKIYINSHDKNIPFKELNDNDIICKVNKKLFYKNI